MHELILNLFVWKIAPISAIVSSVMIAQDFIRLSEIINEISSNSLLIQASSEGCIQSGQAEIDLSKLN